MRVGDAGTLRHLCHPEDVFLGAQILTFAAVVPLLLRFPLPRLRTILTPTRETCLRDPARITKIAHGVDFIEQWGRPLIRPGCLTRGLTLYYFLTRAGVQLDLCFGMGQVDNSFVGHCWLERDGQPFLERTDPRQVFLEVYRIPEPSGRPADQLSQRD